jgi:chemotaxis protein histidine kinase CheA
MLNSNDWQTTYGQFLIESQALLHKSEECLSHLELIGDDEDAIRCLLATLDRLASEADRASIECIADFCRKLVRVLNASASAGSLCQDALQTLRSCLTLVSWQLELIDPTTGELSMDSEEQQELLERLAAISELTEASPDCALK